MGDGFPLKPQANRLSGCQSIGLPGTSGTAAGMRICNVRLIEATNTAGFPACYYRILLRQRNAIFLRNAPFFQAMSFNQFLAINSTLSKVFIVSPRLPFAPSCDHIHGVLLGDIYGALT
jgi:hypothetical protein